MKLNTIVHELMRTDWRDLKDQRSAVYSADVVMDFFGEGTDLRTITYKKILDFIQHLEERDNAGGTINRRLAALSKMYTVAMKHDAKINRPVIPRQKEGKPRQRVLTAAEAEALINWPWKKPEHRDLTVVLIDTGCRPSEITDGVWSLDGDVLTFTDTKNGDDRFVLLTPDAQAAAERLVGVKLVYDAYYHQFKKARKGLKLSDVVVYTIRHTALTKLAERVDNPLLIQKWAGHRNLSTTQRYVKQTRKGMEKLADALRRS